MVEQFAIEQVRKWIDGGGDSWGLPMQSIERVLAGYIEAQAQIAAKDSEIEALRKALTEQMRAAVLRGIDAQFAAPAREKADG